MKYIFILFAVFVMSCTKLAQQELQTQNEAPLDLKLNSSTAPALMSVINGITMDEPNDAVMPLDNNVRSGGIYYETHEDGNGYSGYDSVNNKWLVRSVIKTTYGRTGNGLSYDVPKRIVGGTYDNTTKDRLETTLLKNGDIPTYSNTAHYSGFSIYIPSGKDVIEPDQWFLIHQWWQTAQNSESPPIAFELRPNYYARLGVVVRKGVNKNNHTYQYLTRQDDASGDKFIDLPRNKWIDFVVRWKFDISGNNGELKIYKHEIDAPNSTLIFDYTGQIGYSGVTSPGINEKFGIYRKAGYASDHKVIYDQLKLGDTFNDVKPW
ncbi:heparin lyase I family protein [Niabella aurantiaca]|uniref:heparin lyase I family protein n=1 Tax=Niabella aurantiaca TaxID=379900 RepID=UPI0003A82708|nr:heparin lyase I family protein [Niabella aurantiaca]